ncbi:psbQ-like protein 3, chloroplastic [Euphorbia lathyris]|uniref:psbQ-like protein 3, chloroplastic n=1 Tax=Euphorbia lathyris TaxID=212925 RepID=UPI0033133F38
MASRQLFVQRQIWWVEACVQPKGKQPQMTLQCNVSRRIGAIVTVGSALLAIPQIRYAYAMELEMEQTIEETQNRIKGYGDSLSDVKAFLETQSWKEAQKLLRKSSSNLKLDLYTLIQTKPGNERPLLRHLYFNLFNNVTRLDYAARDKDASRVWQCYGNIVLAYNHILDRL